MRALVRPVVFVLIAAAAGCQSQKIENPSFSITKAEAEAAMEEMKADPRSLDRPLIFVSGFRDPNLGTWWSSLQYEHVINDERVLTVGYFGAKDIEAARLELIDEINAAFPSDDPNWTVPVDVIGISMGGLVSRYAAMPSREDPNAPRLRLVRLFTMASPHRGARIATLNLPDALLLQTRVGSDFMTWINATDTQRGYELLPYVRLGDDVVGPENAAPVGMTPWWLSNPSFEHAHVGGTLDVRFMADVARRLRGEPAFTTPPPAPLPVPEPAPAE